MHYVSSGLNIENSYTSGGKDITINSNNSINIDNSNELIIKTQNVSLFRIYNLNFITNYGTVNILAPLPNITIKEDYNQKYICLPDEIDGTIIGDGAMVYIRTNKRKDSAAYGSYTTSISV